MCESPVFAEPVTYDFFNKSYMLSTMHLSFCAQNAGVPFTIDNQTVHLRGSLTLVCADNIASNLIAGYKSLTSAFRKCRTCMATATDMQTKV